MAIKIKKHKKRLNEDDAPQQQQQQAPAQQQNAQQQAPQQTPAQQQAPQQTQTQLTQDNVKSVNAAILEGLTKATTDAFTSTLGEWIKTDQAKPAMELWNAYKSQPNWEAYLTFYKKFVEIAKAANGEGDNGAEQANISNAQPAQQAPQQQSQMQQESLKSDFRRMLNEDLFMHKVACINLYE